MRAAAIGLVLLVACDEPAPPQPKSQPSVKFQLDAKPDADPAPPDDPPAEPETPEVSEAGPLATGTRAERSELVRTLLSGGANASQLQLVDTDPGKEFRPDLAKAMVPSPPRRTEVVRNGQPTVTGSLAKEIIRRVLRQNLGRYRVCYAKALKTSPELNGKLTVDFTIKPDGKVGSAKVPEALEGADALSKCFVASTKAIRFPEPDGGGIVMVSSPFELRPG